MDAGQIAPRVLGLDIERLLCGQKKAPIAGSGPKGNCIWLVRTRDLILTIAQVVDVPEHRCSRRQVLRYRE